VNQIHNAIRQIGGKVRSKIQAAVLPQPPSHIHPRILLSQRELHIGVSLVVSQEDVVARLFLLDEVVFKRQRFLLVRDDNPFHIRRFAHQRPRLGVSNPPLVEVLAHTMPQALRLADVDHRTLGVLVQINARCSRNRPNFGGQIHMETRGGS